MASAAVPRPLATTEYAPVMLALLMRIPCGVCVILTIGGRPPAVGIESTGNHESPGRVVDALEAENVRAADGGRGEPGRVLLLELPHAVGACCGEGSLEASLGGHAHIKAAQGEHERGGDRRVRGSQRHAAEVVRPGPDGVRAGEGHAGAHAGDPADVLKAPGDVAAAVGRKAASDDYRSAPVTAVEQEGVRPGQLGKVGGGGGRS